MTAGSTRRRGRTRASSATGWSRRLSARQARSRACWSLTSGSGDRSGGRSRAPATSAGPSSSAWRPPPGTPAAAGSRSSNSGELTRLRVDRLRGGGLRGGDVGDRRAVLVALDRLHEVLADAEHLVDLGLALLGDLLVLVEVRRGVVAALAEPLVAVGEERARLGDDAVLEPEVEDAAGAGDPLAELDIELRLLERGRDLVLDDLHADAVADRLGAFLKRLDPADVEPLRREELQRAPAGLGLGRAEHHADLLADLVDEQAEGLRAVQVAGQLAHGLGHHPRLHADGLIAHLALELRARGQSRHGVDRHDVDRAG